MRENRPAREGERRNRGAAALIDAVFPPSDAENSPEASGGPSGGPSHSPSRNPSRSPSMGREESPATDPSALLAGAVSDLARNSETDWACAWLTDRKTGCIRVAAYGRSAEPGPDDLEPEAFEALRRLPRATDLGAPGDEAVGRLSDASGLTAAVALGRSGKDDFEPGLAVLAIGGAEDPFGSVRPRTLALLEETAQQLDGPLATLAALWKIQGLGHDIRWLDRQAALGEMLGEVVHEVRNPLVSVKTFLDLLPEQLDDPEFVTDFRSVVRDEVTRLERLLDSVLQHAQPERRTTGAPAAEADVVAIVENLATLLAYRAGERQIRLNCQAEPEARMAMLSPDSLQQILLNLALNALGATPNGGEVRIRAYEPAVARGEWIEFTVEDTGPGIPEEERTAVFEAFRSSRGDRPGGLGLAISKRLVEEAGGEIRVAESGEGGARVVVRLPGKPA
ncbi:MAG: HAMP domain-containing sensor histidine kinase [Myxococcota bacterium]|nr:HAMP domain-containing sensor histidine kinase [Myxococcota bacterium]